MTTYENLSDAIGLMTAWHAGDDDFTTAHLTPVLEDPQRMVRMIDGLVSLAGILLVKRQQEVGTGEEQTLREMAEQYQDT